MPHSVQLMPARRGAVAWLETNDVRLMEWTQKMRSPCVLLRHAIKPQKTVMISRSRADVVPMNRRTWGILLCIGGRGRGWVAAPLEATIAAALAALQREQAQADAH